MTQPRQRLEADMDFRSLFQFSRRRTRWQMALMLILLVVVLGILGYMLMGMTFVDALYQTVITLTTTGFRDRAAEFSHDSPAVTVFTICLLVFGLSVVALAFSLFTRSLIEGELRDAIGLHRTKRRVRFMKNHYIVCGYGRMGEIIARQMRLEKIPVVVVETDPARRAEAEEAGFTTLNGDATQDETLQEAAVDKAAGLIAVTDADPGNLFITLSARQLNPDLRIVSRALSPDAERKLIRAGANRVILPYKIGAHQISQAALRPNVTDFIEIATRTSQLDIEIEELAVRANSKLVGQTLKETTVLRELGIIVIGIRSSTSEPMRFNPSADTPIAAGDVLICLGKRQGLEKLHKHL